MSINVDFGGLGLAQKVGQLFFIGIEGASLDGATRDLLGEVSPGGICLFSRNIRDARQTRDLLDELRELLPVTPFLSVDQEGGSVDRLRRILTPMPAASTLRSVEDADRLGAIVGEALSILGFNMDFAPVVDVVDEDRGRYQNGILSRTFGDSKEDAIAFGGAFIKALGDHGIVGCLKHFPGLGASGVDSHDELPSIEIPEERLDLIDLFPYREWQRFHGSRFPAVMVAHAAFPGHTLQETDQNGKLLPSSLSYNFVTNLLRGNIGFDGLVITDDLEMGAIIKNFGVGEAGKMAINAGVDMLAICADPHAIRGGYSAVRTAAENGEINYERLDDSLRRVAVLKASIPAPVPFDAARLAELTDEVAAFNDELGGRTN
jgi:beta-N-acetylhexosaminidase